MTCSEKLGLVVLVAAGLGSTWAVAGTVPTLTTFVTGTPIRASEVNANFAAVKAAADATATDVSNNTAAVVSMNSRLAALEWSPARTGSASVGALDFQPSITPSFYSVLRTYDDVAVDSPGGKIGATIRPYPGSTPTYFGCTYVGPFVVSSTSVVTASLWAASTSFNTFGTVRMATFDMSSEFGGIITTGTTAFVGPATFETLTANGNTTTDWRYFVELTFTGPDSVNAKVRQCFVEYSATHAAP
jgi:hypothetical protein